MNKYSKVNTNNVNSSFTCKSFESFIYEIVGFRRNMTETIHGSLLILSELLKHTGDFMIPRFKEICKAIMTFKDHKSKIVKSAIINLLPLLGE